MDENMIQNLVDMLKTQQKQASGDVTNQASSFSPEMLSQFMKSFQKNKDENSSTNSAESTHASITPPQIDLEMLKKLKIILDQMSSQDDPRTNLLLSLKPYLKESRKDKIEKYIQLFHMTQVLELLQNMTGGDSSK